MQKYQWYFWSKKHVKGTKFFEKLWYLWGKRKLRSGERSWLFREKCGVAVGEELVSFADGFFVGGNDAVFVVEGADQHEERGFGQVEVGDEFVDDFELVARVDEDAGAAGACGDAVPAGGFVPDRGGFHGPGGCGAYGDYAPAGLHGLVDQVGCFLVD